MAASEAAPKHRINGGNRYNFEKTGDKQREITGGGMIEKGGKATKTVAA
jgi:hypothetical protein